MWQPAPGARSPRTDMPDTRLSTTLHVLIALSVSRNESDGIVSSSQLAAETGLHPAHVRRMAADLLDADLVDVVRGSAGGFRLGCDPASITVGQIADTLGIEVGFDLHELPDLDAVSTSWHVPNALEELRRELRSASLAVLDRTTLEDLTHATTLRRDLARLLAEGLTDGQIRENYLIKEGRLVPK